MDYHKLQRKNIKKKKFERNSQKKQKIKTAN